MMPIDALVNYDVCLNLPQKQVVTAGSISRWCQSLQVLVLKALLVDAPFGSLEHRNVAAFNRTTQI